MAHKIQDIKDHHEGDAASLDITVRVDGEVQDITGASAEWLLFEDESAVEIAPENAVLVKTGEDGGDETEIEFTDTLDGELTVKIETGDTEGHVNWEEVDSEELIAKYDHRLRVTAADGDRTTQFVGEFEIHK